jgi:hypothetical protein
MTLTNDSALTNSFHETIFRSSQLNSNDWNGWASNYPVSGPSFVTPSLTNIVFLPDSIYRFSTATFTTNLASPFETNTSWPGVTWSIPQWGLSITNRLRCALVDHVTGRLIDFVQFDRMNGSRNLSLEIQDPDNAIGFNGLWSTNRLSGVLPRGIYNQMDVSMGNSGITTDWRSYGLGQATGDTKNKEISKFRVFNGLAPLAGYPAFDTNLLIQVPFTPTKRIAQYISWQANDPFVNALADEINSGTNMVQLLPLQSQDPTLSMRNIGMLNDRFEPWGGSYPKTGGLGGPEFPNAFNLGLKDAGILRSDHWRQTNAEALSLAMLGRIHRGTPWQTLHLKSSQVDLTTWRDWTGYPLDDAALTTPVHDWRLVSLLARLLNTNAPQRLVSANERAADPWLVALNGITVITNHTSTSSEMLMMTSNSPQAGLIAEGIRATRASLPSQAFRTLGDVLAVPELTAASPWLNTNGSSALKRSMTDEAYEAIPSHLLSRLRPDSLGTITLSNGLARLEFTGFDGYPYAVQSSTNLNNWTGISTNSPTNGVFSIATPRTASPPPVFFRSVLLP